MKYVYFQLWRRYNTITLSSTLEKLLIDVDGISALEMARYSNVFCGVILELFLWFLEIFVLMMILIFSF